MKDRIKSFINEDDMDINNWIEEHVEEGMVRNIQLSNSECMSGDTIIVMVHYQEYGGK